jgi:hypothetical protein
MLEDLYMLIGCEVATAFVIPMLFRIGNLAPVDRVTVCTSSYVNDFDIICRRKCITANGGRYQNI